MNVVHIKNVLWSIGVDPESVPLGEFDVIGEFTAKRIRDRSNPLFNKSGAFYRSNYERGILIYYLITQFKLTSMLEIGFGRGYSSLCAGKAFADMGVDGTIVSIDPAIAHGDFMNFMQVLPFPKEWSKNIQIITDTSNVALPTLDANKFDLIYIDGDHSYVGTRSDWNNAKNKANMFVLFDDYHLPTKVDAGIKCQEAIDEIEWEKEGFSVPQLVRMDRRMFYDDRFCIDEDVDYGQVLTCTLDKEHLFNSLSSRRPQ